MTYRIDRNSTEMAALLGKAGERYNSDALDFANQYGISANPRNVDPAKMEKMRQKRQDNIRKDITTDERVIKSKMDVITNNVTKAVRYLEENVDTVKQIWFNPTDGKYYYENVGKMSSDFSKARAGKRGNPVYFNPAWGLVINYNKMAAGWKRATTIGLKGWDNQELMNRAARSSWRTLLRNAKNNKDFASQEASAIANLSERYAAKAQAVQDMRALLGMTGGGARRPALTTQMNVESTGTAPTRGSGGNAAGWASAGS